MNAELLILVARGVAGLIDTLQESGQRIDPEVLKVRTEIRKAIVRDAEQRGSPKKPR